jgi:hypothetical protein
MSGRPPHEDWAEVLVTGALDADILKAALETAGIPVMVRAEAAGGIIGITVGGLGDVAIFVPEDRLSEARELLDGSTSLDFPEGD